MPLTAESTQTFNTILFFLMPFRRREKNTKHTREKKLRNENSTVKGIDAVIQQQMSNPNTYCRTAATTG